MATNSTAKSVLTLQDEIAQYEAQRAAMIEKEKSLRHGTSSPGTTATTTTTTSGAGRGLMGSVL